MKHACAQLQDEASVVLGNVEEDQAYHRARFTPVE